jgi:hypothetical protein
MHFAFVALHVLGIAAAATAVALPDADPAGFTEDPYLTEEKFREKR